MEAPGVYLLLLVFASLCAGSAYSNNEDGTSSVRKVELYDGVYVKIPENTNATRKLMSFELDTSRTGDSGETGRSKHKKIMKRILPMFILPFVFQSTIVPLFLGVLKFMLFKSLMIGKLALVLIIINAFKNSNSFKGRHDADIANLHYGYHGRSKHKKIMKRILPMFILPFVFQSTIVPLFLGVLKFMLFKSLMIGKLALVLIIINAFKNSNSFKGRHDADIANLHYGYHGNGMEEFASHFNS